MNHVTSISAIFVPIGFGNTWYTRAAIPPNTTKRYVHVIQPYKIIPRSRRMPITSGLGSPNPNNHSRKRHRASAKVRAWRFGIFNQSDNKKKPSKRMKGEPLIIIVDTHVVVANKKAAFLNEPSGNKAHASVAHAAITSTVIIPAPLTAIR